jgi:hypothetical protein
MKKSIAAIAIIASTIMMPAHAGSYAQAVEDQRVCGEVAKSTAELYIWKQRGISWE